MGVEAKIRAIEHLPVPDGCSPKLLEGRKWLGGDAVGLCAA